MSGYVAWCSINVVASIEGDGGGERRGRVSPLYFRRSGGYMENLKKGETYVAPIKFCIP